MSGAEDPHSRPMIVTGGFSGIRAATARATAAAGVFTTTPQILTACREPLTPIGKFRAGHVLTYIPTALPVVELDRCPCSSSIAVV